ncbi:hypothetical protein [Sphingomonas hengshuiensis]|uniref:Uncharacterized protein n=1 Tax=Sphingomonas hengshuiensis TaxID=1609977 RepID=A0A7U4JAD2_9SPHN|nr:hypothetical protein [Sphingomonas hengshuiensis]AJP73156.1 hypothetical protein TS85_17190 [Sphingomonas hengshuiensis]
MSPADALTRAEIVMPAAMLISSAGTRLVVPGPEWLVVAGVALPIFSSGAGVLGVVLGMWLAPARAIPLGWRRQGALVVTLLAIILCSVIATGQQPLVALGWGIGLGFSGLTVAELLGEQARSALKTIGDAFIAHVAGRVGGGKGKDSDNG